MEWQCPEKISEGLLLYYQKGNQKNIVFFLGGRITYTQDGLNLPLHRKCTLQELFEVYYLFIIRELSKQRRF